MPLPLPLPPLPDDTSPFSVPCGRGVRPEPPCPPVLPSGGAVSVLPAALRTPLCSVLCQKQINTSKFCKECELTLRLGEWRAARDAALDRYGTDYATMRKIEAETFRARKGENQTRRGEAYQQALTMLGDEEDFKYLTRVEKARRKTVKCKELTMAVAELLQPDQPLLQVFQEAGRRIRSLSNMWAKVEELDAAAKEAKKAGQHAKAVELNKQHAKAVELNKQA